MLANVAYEQKERKDLVSPLSILRAKILTLMSMCEELLLHFLYVMSAPGDSKYCLTNMSWWCIRLLAALVNLCDPYLTENTMQFSKIFTVHLPSTDVVVLHARSGLSASGRCGNSRSRLDEIFPIQQRGAEPAVSTPLSNKRKLNRGDDGT